MALRFPIPRERALDILQRARRSDPATARVAGFELGECFLGEKFIDEVAALLDHAEPAVREGACRALGMIEVY